MPKPKPKSKAETYPLGERIGDFAKWTWEGMTRDIKKNLNKVSKSLDLYRDPKSMNITPIEPRTPAEDAELKGIFGGENMPQLKPKQKKKAK